MEVDGHGGSFDLYDATHPVGIVGNSVVDCVRLDRRLGIRLERTTGQMPSWSCWFCHHLEYAPASREPGA
jgi:hypothetical protein